MIVHDLGRTAHPDLAYPFDPLLVTERGAIALRSGKETRRGEEDELERWTGARGIPTLGRISAPGTVDGGDTFWLRPDLFCIGRTLRTNDAGVRQLAGLVGGDVRVFDVPFWHGTAELVHLLSVISPVADDLAVVHLPLLPVGLWELLGDLGIRLVERAGRGVPDARLQRPRGPAGRLHRRGRQPGDETRPGGGRLRGPRVPGAGDRHQRLRRPDLPHATHPPTDVNGSSIAGHARQDSEPPG